MDHEELSLQIVSMSLNPGPEGGPGGTEEGGEDGEDTVDGDTN